MIEPNYVIEEFEIDPNHISATVSSIYNTTIQKWIKVDFVLVKLLVSLLRARINVEYYHNNMHDMASLTSCENYKRLLDIVAEYKIVLRPYANIFCIAHRGYSLN